MIMGSKLIKVDFHLNDLGGDCQLYCRMSTAFYLRDQCEIFDSVDAFVIDEMQGFLIILDFEHVSQTNL